MCRPMLLRGNGRVEPNGASRGMFAGSRHPAGRPSSLAAPPAIANRCRFVEHHLAEERSPRAP
eukprot:scaffold39660_cov21-Phaeocystis_antarctica.AAC.1